MGHPSDLHAFALGDLTGASEAAIAAHVASCRRCRREVRRIRDELTATVDALPAVAPSTLGRERALTAARAAMWADQTLEDSAAGARTAMATTTPATRRMRLPAWSGWALAAIVAITAAVTAAGVALERHAAWRAIEAERALVAGWLTRSDVTTWPLPAEQGARSPGSVLVADDGTVLVVMRAPAPAGTAYRAWGIGPAGATALGDVPRTVLRTSAAGYDQVLVSRDPLGDAAEPSEHLGSAPLPAGRTVR